MLNCGEQPCIQALSTFFSFLPFLPFKLGLGGGPSDGIARNGGSGGLRGGKGAQGGKVLFSFLPFLPFKLFAFLPFYLFTFKV